MVIGKRKDIKARVLQLWCEHFRLAKPVADFGLATLFELAALVQNGALEVAKRDVSRLDKRCDVFEELCVRFWKRLRIRVVCTEHDVADGSDGDGFIGLCFCGFCLPGWHCSTSI